MRLASCPIPLLCPGSLTLRTKSDRLDYPSFPYPCLSRRQQPLLLVCLWLPSSAQIPCPGSCQSASVNPPGHVVMPLYALR